MGNNHSKDIVIINHINEGKSSQKIQYIGKINKYMDIVSYIYCNFNIINDVSVIEIKMNGRWHYRKYFDVFEYPEELRLTSIFEKNLFELEYVKKSV